MYEWTCVCVAAKNGKRVKGKYKLCIIYIYRYKRRMKALILLSTLAQSTTTTTTTTRPSRGRLFSPFMLRWICVCSPERKHSAVGVGFYYSRRTPWAHYHRRRRRRRFPLLLSLFVCVQLCIVVWYIYNSCTECVWSRWL